MDEKETLEDTKDQHSESHMDDGNEQSDNGNGPSRKGAYNEPYQKGMYRFVDQGFYKLEAKMLDFQDETSIGLMQNQEEEEDLDTEHIQTKCGELTMGRWTH